MLHRRARIGSRGLQDRNGKEREGYSREGVGDGQVWWKRRVISRFLLWTAEWLRIYKEIMRRGR
jgi:hypothetical protein